MTDKPVLYQVCFRDIPTKLAQKFKATCALTENKETGKPYRQREAIIELMESFVARATKEGITL